MIDSYSAIHYIYELFYKKLYGNEKYIFNPTEKMHNCIFNFIELIDKKYKITTLNIDFYIYYFLFQFDYWLGINAEGKYNVSTFSDRINITYILGQKAFERWINRNSNFDYKMYQSTFAHKYNISIINIKKHFIENEYPILNQAEEIEKRRFYNTDRSLNHCLEKTTLYNHRSRLCIMCINKKDCKILLANNYINIYKSRGYKK